MWMSSRCLPENRKLLAVGVVVVFRLPTQEVGGSIPVFVSLREVC